MSSSYAAPARRPVLLSIVTVLMIVAGALSVIVGIVVFAMRDGAEFIAEVGETSLTRTSVGVAFIISGVISILLGLGLRRGSRVARVIVAVYVVIHIIFAIFAVIRLDHGTFFGSSIVTILFAVAVLYYLYGTQKSREFFA